MIDNILKAHIDVLNEIINNHEFKDQIDNISALIADCFNNENKLLLCGNGGSAADAQHIATEFVSRFKHERRALNAEALTVNTSLLTAIGNDYNFNKIFSRQVEAIGKKGDILIGISTSGNSSNIIEALKTARSLGILTISMTGINTESPVSQISDHCISVPSNSTPRIQEIHILIGHIICELVEINILNK